MRSMKVSKEKKDELAKQAEESAKEIIAAEAKELGLEKPEPLKEKVDEIQAYKNRRALLKQNQFRLEYHEAELADLNDILDADWNADYYGPFIKDDRCCMISGGELKPFSYRSKRQLTIDKKVIEDEILKFKNVISKLQKLIAEFQEQHPGLEVEED